MTTRNPSEIAFERARETFILFASSTFVVAILPALATMQDDLSICSTTPHTCVVHWDVWIEAFYRFSSAGIAALIAALGKYTVALKSAAANVTVTGTTAPQGTPSAPHTIVNGGGETVIAPKAMAPANAGKETT